MIGKLLHNLFGSRFTVGELMSIDEGRQMKAGGCTVELVNTFYSIKEESVAQKFRSLFSSNLIKVFYITFKFKVKSDTGNSHTVFIQLDPDFSSVSWSSNKVRIYCGCADFKYRSAYTLNKRGSLFNNDFTRLSLGQALTDSPKGKRGTTLLCKHSYAALNWLVNIYQSLMYTL